MSQHPRLAIHIRDYDVIVILAEQQLRAIRGVCDSGKGTSLQSFGRISRSTRRSEVLKNLSGDGIEYDDWLRRAHQQYGTAMRDAVRIEYDGLGAYRRSKFNNSSGWGQCLVIRHYN